MDWFEQLTGFREVGYADTKARLRCEGGRLHSLANGASHGVGVFSLVSLAQLRARVQETARASGPLQVSIIEGDVRALHRSAQHQGALFQVASQFNMLEMIGPDVTPEHGVTRYQHDRTQGPACAMAAGAATIFRNYFVPIGDERGQTATRQIDGLADLGQSLAAALDIDLADLWTMRNGYALPTRKGLTAIAAHLAALDNAERDALRRQLALGLHEDVEVTNRPERPGQTVSQIFCSALPVAYSSVGDHRLWRDFATLVLEAAYEATILAGALNLARGASSTVLLTSLGGGAFGNREGWILSAMRRALRLAQGSPLDVRIVSYGPPSPGLRELVESFRA